MISDIAHQFEKEVQILDSLDASLQQVLAEPQDENSDKKEVEAPRLFKSKLELVTDKNVSRQSDLQRSNTVAQE